MRWSRVELAWVVGGRGRRGYRNLRMGWRVLVVGLYASGKVGASWLGGACG